ncbi:hypothetical protein RB653_007812 [Dictyostelium firmibasis]|uniref:Uncharacterized protein n=1 Tax=Dictyostelium firmibasis TaxID=79012 RepID=A0AAN7TW93_9MYCE
MSIFKSLFTLNGFQLKNQQKSNSVVVMNNGDKINYSLQQRNESSYLSFTQIGSAIGTAHA